ncbi:hypothetical protein [Longitalea luteola]|uniref:hypothetical protein n=1 Tax=Longitalea luteola TaxID=2812563 RepID=UPI001A97C808|nr:hypothetical protein [Longitalea luteola]
MQKGNRILKLGSWIAGVSVLMLIYSIAVTQDQAKNRIDRNRPTISADSLSQEEDSVEMVGTPTDDDPWKEVAKLVNAYYQKGGVEYKGFIKVIDDNGNEEKVMEEHPFEYTIFNTDYYYHLATMEVVKKKDLLLAVDNEKKTISIARNAVVPKGNKVFDMRAFKKVMEKGKAHALVTRLGDEKVLTIDNINDPDIQGYRIYYSPQTYRVHRMLIGMARLNPLEDESQKEDKELANTANEEAEIDTYYYYLEILFKEVEPLSLQAKDFSPEKRFMQLNQDSITLTPAYKDYELLNPLEP